MKKLIAIAVCAPLALGSAVCSAEQEGNLMVRVRAVDVQPANDSSAVGFGSAIPNDAIRVASKTIPEVDISYFFSKNLAAELILTYPQKLDVNVSSSAVGAFKAGTIKALPPTLTLQYHFMPDAQFRPYVGAGINYTIISGVSLGQLDAVTTILTAGPSTNSVDKSSWGGALQAGFDYKVGPNMFINFDIKKVYIRTDLKNNVVGKLSTLKVDPLLVGVGIGYRF